MRDTNGALDVVYYMLASRRYQGVIISLTMIVVFEMHSDLLENIQAWIKRGVSTYQARSAKEIVAHAMKVTVYKDVGKI